jgi:hypothetical protein
MHYYDNWKRTRKGLYEVVEVINEINLKVRGNVKIWQLVGLDRQESYVDDILQHTTVTWDEHLDVLRDIFARVRQAGLTLRPSKSLIGYRNIGFIGQVIGEGKVAMETKQLEQIMDAAHPMTKKQVRSCINFYRQVIPNFRGSRCTSYL